jgi:hypothetical protein
VQHRVPFAFAAATLALLAASTGFAPAEPTGNPSAAPALIDPARPVTRITRDSFELGYFTSKPCPTRVQVRAGGPPFASLKLRGQTNNPWSDPNPGQTVRVVEGTKGDRTTHWVKIDGLEPGHRYDYRIFDPSVDPTSEEIRWGAAAPGGSVGSDGWRREYSVSTLAADGHKTIVRYPVKVLLMPNVINIESTLKDPAAPADKPAKVTPEQMLAIREELNRASRFFFVNSHMRLWVDFTVAVDDRWQRWGPTPDNADEFYKEGGGWPLCRSYAGEDYHSPGGGEFTTVDMHDPLKVLDGSIVEDPPFYGQVEIAFPRRWNPGKHQWDYYTSGGGTLGVDSVPSGIPARSQFFGGYDTAWLTTHEVHHQLESLGRLSLADREDERIVYNHWAPRSRTRSPDAASGPEGAKGVYPWSSSDRHGEHYDGMAYWDRTLTDAQWLRMYLTDTVVVTDADNDGFPDDDPRLPIDEKRFGSRADTPTTDGRMNDLDKAMLSTWAPAPLQARFEKPNQTFGRPNPTSPDSDGDGADDGVDLDPLIAHEPFIWPLTAAIDGDATEWKFIPPSGTMKLHEPAGPQVEFRQGHDDAAYYGLIRARGDWAQIRIVLEPEGRGVYTSDSTQAIRILNGDEIKVDHKDRFFPRAPGLKWAAKRHTEPDGWDDIEFSLPNMGEGLMYWRGAGREIGSYIEVTDSTGAIRSVYEPYRLFYCRMLERPGKDPMPPAPPSELSPDQPGVITLKPGDNRLTLRGRGWKLDDNAYRHSGPSEDAIFLDNLNAADFDLWIRVEARSDAILGAFAPGSPMGATHDYIAFVGGYANTRSRLRLFGTEAGDTAAVVTPGRHTMQLSRHAGTVWSLWDGQPILWAADPEPKTVVDRLAILGGYGGNQVIHEIRYRTTAAPAAPVTPSSP